MKGSWGGWKDQGPSKCCKKKKEEELKVEKLQQMLKWDELGGVDDNK